MVHRLGIVAQNTQRVLHLQILHYNIAPLTFQAEPLLLCKNMSTHCLLEDSKWNDCLSDSKFCPKATQNDEEDIWGADTIPPVCPTRLAVLLEG